LIGNVMQISVINSKGGVKYGSQTKKHDLAEKRK